KVPTDLMLLPGHIFHLLEALHEEQDCRATQGCPITPQVPSCVFKLTQLEAEWLLEWSTGGGTMVLRPGEHGQGLSVTTRQEVNGTVLLKHYRVNHVGQGYIITTHAGDVPPHHHPCSLLAEVVQDFVESSKGSLQPLQQKYSLQLEFVEMDSENGEETLGVCEPPMATPIPQP
ncbi:STAP2 protein, partial [Lophotis ruficrista]|nr:STAP2 protein [Lophotis ruficrista]